MKINILGTEYEITYTDESKDSRLRDAWGYHACIEKEILIDAHNFPHEGKEFQKRVLRHEIVHAFFEQCGLVEYCNNEQLVHWIANKFPEMLAAFQEVNAL